MTSGVSGSHDINWVINSFRPFLKKLNLRNITEKSQLYKTYEHHELLKCGIWNVVVIPMRYSFTNKDYKGVFVWRYDSEADFYALYIIINDSFYTNDDLETQIIRKAIAVHEFTHCVAAMLSISRIKSEVLQKKLQETLYKKVHAIETSDIHNLLIELTLQLKDIKKLSQEVFPDEHFRTCYDDFDGDYSELYRNFLLSMQLFLEYFTKEKQDIFLSLLKGSKISESLEVLQTAIGQLNTQKALDKMFIINRIIEEFLPIFRNKGKSFL